MRRAVAVGLLALLAACTNDPYPDADEALHVRYRALEFPPKTYDPAVSYNVREHWVTAEIYETLLEYHYLKRPYQLMPGLAREVPEPRPLPDGRSVYTFRLRPDLLFQDDGSFSRFEAGRKTREIQAADVAFQLMRLADPEVGSPIAPNLVKIDGFTAFGERLRERRESDPEFGGLRPDRQYAAVGGIRGIVVRGSHELDVIVSEPNPQLIFWFAMPFTAPVPWEAVAWWDGQEGRDFFKDHPVGSGPFKLGFFERQRRVVLERNPNWYGIRHPEWRAPGATFPTAAEAGPDAAIPVDPAYAGRPLPFLDRIDFRLEVELIPQFTKFMQGYYDQSKITKEGFDRVVTGGNLSEDMAARGIELQKAPELDIWYVGFNMRDPTVGAPAGTRGQKLRQAMSLAIDAREFVQLFYNGRGVPAQSPVPPGLFGYDAAYRNPYRQPDLERARALLAEAGYPQGIDPGTGKPLELTFDALDPSTARLLQFQFLTAAWARLGLDVEIEATSANQFRDKVDRGAHQIFLWGWIADYPDPENFLLLLWGPNGRSLSGGPNFANFQDSRFDALFVEMRDRADDPRRAALIDEMRGILAERRPWIELFHSEKYALVHGWLKNHRLSGLVAPEGKYLDIDPNQRTALQAEWNRPITWPAWLLAGLALAAIVPGVRTVLRERQ
jgi:oligopeptide transport system substrate-binding protein